MAQQGLAPEIQTLLGQLIAIPSVFPNEAAVSGFIERFLTEHGFSVARIMSEGNRPNLVARNDLAGPAIGFYGHMDTVPADPRYDRNPFELRVEDNRYRGLGVVDMKGGLTCILLAAVRMRDEVPMRLVFGVDEEDQSVGAHDLCDSGLLGDIRYLVVAESGQVDDFSKPFSVGFGRKGRCVIEVQVHGRSAHAACASQAVNAIEEAARFLGHLRDLRFPLHPDLGATELVVQSIESRASSFSVPDRCLIGISALTTPGASSQELCEELSRLGMRIGVDLSVRLVPRKTPYCEPYALDTEHPFTKHIIAEVMTPAKVRGAYMASVADENIFARRLGIPVLTMGVTGAGDHTAEEWADTRSFSHVVAGYIRIMELWKEVGATMQQPTIQS